MDKLPKLALSIRQPWAWAICQAGKDIENRDWSTRFRGPVAIHAAKGMTRDEYEDFIHTVHAISRIHSFPEGLTVPGAKELQRGGIIGTAEIVDCVRRSDSPWYFGRWGFVLANARAIPFIPVKGQLGFFEWRRNLAGDT